MKTPRCGKPGCEMPEQIKSTKDMESEARAELIADLFILKSHLISNYSLDQNIVNPNITYCVFETIIAHLMDKYKVSDRDVRRILILKNIKN